MSRQPGATPRRPKSPKSDAASHAFKNGETVAVLAIGPSGRPFIEGRARIRAACARPHHYHVRFLNEHTDHIRFVSPEWQDNPKRTLELLLEFWRASTAPPALDEFFPDDND